MTAFSLALLASISSRWRPLPAWKGEPLILTITSAPASACARCGPVAYEGLREAMDWFEKAETLRKPGNDDALLRWNTCARFIMQHNELHPAPEDDFQPFLE